jgi:molybdopterin-biosynthesis enzyme MoeA-like protein
MASFCFQLGIVRLSNGLRRAGLTYWQNLKRIEVIADEEEEIGEAVQRMSTSYDFVVTSGGIGPT